MATVRVQRDDFDPGAEAEGLARGRKDVGAVASFVGYCRDEGGRLAALELEHYAGMAEEEIARATGMVGSRRASGSSLSRLRRRIAARRSRRPRC
ncbi:MAG: molybdenum cofactor biosynthesis protein MoaE [Roseiarcus sp.]